MRAQWHKWFLFLSLVHAVSGQPPAGNDTELVCHPFGTCEPCPADALEEPFCQPFGNRRLMHCTPASAAPHHHPPPPPPPHHPPHEGDAAGYYGPVPADDAAPAPAQGQIPGWESCGRIVAQERAHFYEFLACNVLAAAAALGLLFARSRRLRALHARQLAARIGLVRPPPAGWTDG